MLTPEPGGSTTGEEAAGRTPAERYADEEWLQAIRAHRRMTVERHLAVRQIDWASHAMGESLYMHTLWVLKWEGHDSFGSKISSRNQVETELGISLGESGEGREDISIVLWWVMLKENSTPHLMVSQLEMWEILMGRVGN